MRGILAYQMFAPIARSSWRHLPKFGLQTRQFSTPMFLRVQASTILHDNTKEELKTLKAKLTKEKKVLSDLQKRLKKKEAQNLKKQKQRKQLEKAKTAKAAEKLKLQKAKKKEADAEKALVKKATQNFRKITALNAFVKEKVNKDVTLKSAMEEWNQLSVDEKESFQEKADEINAQRDELFKPKPRRPTSSYALFLKLNYPSAPVDFASASREVLAKWKELPEEEKLKYAISDEEKAQYQKAIKAWTEERVKAYKEFIKA